MSRLQLSHKRLERTYMALKVTRTAHYRTGVRTGCNREPLYMKAKNLLSKLKSFVLSACASMKVCAMIT